MLKSLPARAIVPIVVVLTLTVSVLGAFAANLIVPARPVTEMSVLDSRGRLVGSVIDVVGGTAIVVVRLGSTPVALQASRSQLGPAGNTRSVILNFESADCTGQPYASGEVSPDDLFPVVPFNGTRLFEYSGPIRVITFNSYLNQEGTHCQMLTSDDFVSPVMQIGDFAEDFRPPFRLVIVGRD